MFSLSNSSFKAIKSLLTAKLDVLTTPVASFDEAWFFLTTNRTIWYKH